MDALQVLQTIIEALFAVIMTGIGYTIKTMSGDIRELTKATNGLRVEMVRDFVGKDEWARVRDRVQEIDSQVAALQVIADQHDRRRNQYEDAGP